MSTFLFISSKLNQDSGRDNGGFCVPYPVELIVKKHHGLFDVRYQVLDVNGNLFLQVDGSYKALHNKHIMRDPAGFPILTMREKAINRQHWTAHRDESLDRNISNFQVVGSFPSQSSKVYQGNTVIAEVNYYLPWKSSCKSRKEDFRVKIYPGVEYAFIVALLIMLTESNLMSCAV
ncbi:hypothetical protein PTKIN_Ptkin01aG0146300 [Pterospermum kingtungense]